MNATCLLYWKLLQFIHRSREDWIAFNAHVDGCPICREWIAQQPVMEREEVGG